MVSGVHFLKRGSVRLWLLYVQAQEFRLHNRPSRRRASVECPRVSCTFPGIGRSDRPRHLHRQAVTGYNLVTCVGTVDASKLVYELAGVPVP